MKPTFLAAILLAPSLLSAGIVRSQAIPVFDLNSPGAILFTSSLSSEGAASPVVDSNSPGSIVFGDPNGMFSPGALLAEWNPVPDVAVRLSGISAVDDYPTNYTPGGILAGNADDVQFTPAAFIFSSPSAQSYTLGVTPGQFAPTNALQFVGSSVPTSVQEFDITSSALAAPEPGSLSAVTLGGMGILALAWKRRRTPAKTPVA